MIRDLIWEYPLAFAWTVCIGATIISALGVAASLSIKQKDDDE